MLPAFILRFLATFLAEIALRPVVQFQVYQTLVLIVPLIRLSLLRLPPLHTDLDWLVDCVERNFGAFLSVQNALLLLLKVL